MIKIEFSTDDIEQLLYKCRYHKSLRVHQRTEAWYLKALGFQHQEIGRIMQINQKTLRSYLQMYQEGGI